MEFEIHGSEIECLTENVEVRGADHAEAIDSCVRVACGYQGKRIDSLVAHFRGLNVAADGVGEEAEFGCVGCNVDVGAFQCI